MLDIKYRPRKFSDVVGNQGVVRALLTRSRNGSLQGRSFMFGGPKGCGKTSLARITARAASCSFLTDGEPCNQCDRCVGILDETSTFFDEFDAASHGSVDRIRGMMDELDYGNVDGLSNILILDEAHRLGPAAQDAMLKAVEERRLTVILCTTEPSKIRPAMRDRVEEYPIRPPTEEDLVRMMVSICKLEGIEVDSDSLSQISRFCGNTPRSCLNSIWSLHSSGSISPSSVREMFRVSQIEALSDFLKKADSDPSLFFSLDSIIGSESPTWVRDTIVNLISSAFRTSMGLPSKQGYPVGFFESRDPNSWLSLAKHLASLDRPNPSDIELAFISTAPSQATYRKTTDMSAAVKPDVTIHSIESISPPQPVKLPTPSIESDLPQKTARSLSTLEVDGVTFRSDERLTSLDDKIEQGKGSPRSTSKDDSLVESLDRSKVPLSEQEFSRVFLERFSQK